MPINIKKFTEHLYVAALKNKRFGNGQCGLFVRTALQAGVQAYLTKDVLHDDLLKAIRAVHAGHPFLPPSVAKTLAAEFLAPDLSAREMEVLSLIVNGLANKQIAHQLNIAEHTVKNHVKSILSKLNVADRTQAATAAIQRGIIHLP